MSMIKTLIVDDESFARRRISRLLESQKDIEIIGECKDGQEAIDYLQKQPVDLIFLDIQMPLMNGFEVLEKLDPDEMPVIIFVTAYDKYALKAFEVHAIDYLLKPFDDDRFYDALQYVRDQFASPRSVTLKARLINLLRDLTSDFQLKQKESSVSRYPERLLIKSGGKIYFVKTNSIIRIKSAGKYLEILSEGITHTLRQTMNEMESKLDPGRFVRINRSTIINIDQVKEIQPWFKGQHLFIMNNGEQFNSGSGYRTNLDKIFKKFS